jgi:adenylate kinase family enzyme
MQQRVVAEIIGPAGAGKSTLVQALRRRDPHIRTGLSVWGLPPSLLVSNAFLSLPALPALFRRRGLSCLNELSLVVRLNALHRFLTRANSQGTLLMDEGAIFAIVKLHGFNRESADAPLLEACTKVALDRWARTLDVVIWLDAPDAVLVRRIRERHKWHQVKDRTDVEIRQFLAHYRRSYEQIIAELSARGKLRIIRLSTERDQPERIAEEILVGIRGDRRAHVVG